MSSTNKDLKQYPQKWQERFAFFEQYGPPKTPAHKSAIRGVDFKKRILINMNFFALVFGIIYFCILGMWKKGLVLFAITSVLGIVICMVGFFFNINLSSATAAGIAVIYGLTANYCYYLKEIKGDDDWNPFKGLQM